MFETSESQSAARTKAEIARENGAKSHGPVTPEGKARSSQNSLKHSLTASELVCLHHEDQELFNSLYQSYADTWRPENIVERDFVEEMATAKWQERRAISIETALFDLQMQRATKEEVEKRFQTSDEMARLVWSFVELADHSRALSLLRRYRTDHIRDYHRAVKQLMALRAKGTLHKSERRNEPTGRSNAHITNGETALAQTIVTVIRPVYGTDGEGNCPYVRRAAASAENLRKTA